MKPLYVKLGFQQLQTSFHYSTALQYLTKILALACQKVKIQMDNCNAISPFSQ